MNCRKCFPSVIFPTCDLELLPMPLIIESVVDSVKMNSHAKYLGQGSFFSFQSVCPDTQTDTQRTDYSTRPLKLAVKIDVRLQKSRRRPYWRFNRCPRPLTCSLNRCRGKLRREPVSFFACVIKFTSTFPYRIVLHRHVTQQLYSDRIELQERGK